MPYIALSKQLPSLRGALLFELDSYLTSFIQSIMRPSTMIQSLMLSASVRVIEPAAIYNGGFNTTNTIALRIGNGGAGQSGLIEGINHPSSPPTHRIHPPSNTLPTQSSPTPS